LTVARPFAIGDRDLLSYDGDGFLNLHLQHANPGVDRESNLRPSRGPLGVTMRVYAPKAEALDGRWRPPVVHKA
jgi:hypothetical protein